MLAPVFPGCHVICRPATYHGIEPPPFLPSLDKRAGVEPALSLLVTGGDLGFPLVMVIVQDCPRRSRQPAIWHQVTSRITTAHSPTRSTARYLPRGGRLPGTGCEPCFFLEPAAGFEPATSGLQVRCSTAELHRLGAGGRNRTDDKRLGRTLFYR